MEVTWDWNLLGKSQNISNLEARLLKLVLQYWIKTFFLSEGEKLFLLTGRFRVCVSGKSLITGIFSAVDLNKRWPPQSTKAMFVILKIYFFSQDRLDTFCPGFLFNAFLVQVQEVNIIESLRRQCHFPHWQMLRYFCLSRIAHSSKHWVYNQLQSQDVLCIWDLFYCDLGIILFFYQTRNTFSILAAQQAISKYKSWNGIQILKTQQSGHVCWSGLHS